MRRFFQKMGVLIFFAAWPAFYFYFRRGERTRAVVEHAGKVLVTKNWISDNKWSLPGGGLHSGEPLMQGVVRELREETGLHVQTRQLRFIAKCQYRQYGLKFDFNVFRLNLEESPVIKRQSHEISETAWLDPNELNTKNAATDTLQALRKIGVN